MNNQAFDIDLVYLWCDDNDEKWAAKRNAFLGAISNVETNCKGRWANNDELKYSLRSVEKYAPWIRRVFIVTDNQIPDWLDVSNPKIQIVDHKEILPEEALPCYNTCVIDYFLYKIPELAEHFLFANDDTFFNTYLEPGFFFKKDGYPIVRLERKFWGKLSYLWKKIKKRQLGTYRQTILNSAKLVEHKFGKFYSGLPHHNIDSYLRNDFQHAAEQEFNNEISPTIKNHIRNNNDFNRIVFSYYALAKKRAHIKYVNKYESFCAVLSWSDFEELVEQYNPKLLCLNDDQLATDDDRQRGKEFLSKIFSEKSNFEL